MAAKLAMKEGMAACSPVLLEPVMKVEIYTPNDATAKITAIVPQRRGQILGYDARPGWPGWDVVEATMPQSAIGDLIVELRSATAGVASYSARFDHMAELTGRLADEAMNATQGRLKPAEQMRRPINPGAAFADRTAGGRYGRSAAVVVDAGAVELHRGRDDGSGRRCPHRRWAHDRHAPSRRR